jgi:hypothetical protein
VRTSALLLAGVVLACQNPMAVSADQSFTLDLGQTVQIRDAGFSLRFQSVPSDSRCPINAMCVWAGNAAVQLVAHFGPSQALTPDLPLILNTTIDPHALPVGGYLVELHALAPQPVAGQPQPRNYRATLRVTTLGRFP